MRTVLASIICGLTLLSGCAVESAESQDDLETSEDELTATDKLTGIVQGSVEGNGILKAANSLSEAELGFCRPGEVCLDLNHAYLDASQVARMIAYRAGGDGKAGTRDDRKFRSLSVLRRETAKPNVVDQFTFQSLLRVAMHRGWAHPYNAAQVLAIPDGSREAAAMLRIANSFDRGHLGFGASGESHAYLDWWVADAIIGHRAGPDGVSGTADDTTFRSLAELRSIALSHDVLAHAVHPSEETAETAYTLAQLARMARCTGVGVGTE